MLYGNIHRFLLRTIASQSVMSIEDIKSLVRKKTGNEQVNIRETIQEINDCIKPLKQMIKIVNDEITSEELVVFLSLGYDDTTKAQNVFTPVELEFFRLLMEQIMSTDTREITDITAINLVNNIKVNNKLLSIVDAQKLLDIWCHMRYLDHEDKNYVLGVRAIHEFESYFSQTLADSANMKCYICSSIVFRGYNCPYCPKTIHSRCLDVSLKKAQKWPCCKRAYIHSQLQELRGQSSRLSESSRLQTQRLESTQSLEETQRIEETQQMELTQSLVETQRLEDTQPMNPVIMSSPDDSPAEEMETAEERIIRVRPRKRRRLNS